MMLASSSGLSFTVDMLGWALLHFLWQGALAGVIYAIARPLCSGVAARYRLGMSMLGLMFVCPFLTMFWLWPTAGAAVIPTTSAATALQGLSDAVVAAAGGVSGWHFEKLLPWLVGVWLCGVSFIATRTFMHWRQLNWLVKFASVPVPEYQVALKRLCERFSVTRPVRLLCSFKLATPMMIGWIKPVILLPASMLSGFSAHQIELIIAHELGHVRRWDYLLNLAQVLIETVLFYHPVVHWISNDVRDARESCCDDLVLTLAQASPLVYARALADLEEMRHDIPAAPALAANGGVLLTRIRRIVGVSTHAYEPLPRSSGWPALIALFAGVALLLGRMHFAQQPVLAALAQMPAQTLALVTGNSQLGASTAVATSVPTLAPSIKPVPKPDVVAIPARAIVPPVTATPLEERIPVQQVARPRISVVASADIARPRVENIRASLPVLSAPSLDAVTTNSTLATATVPRPVPTRLVQPSYPGRADLRGVTGEVQLEYSIADDGEVRDVLVVRSDPPEVFDEAALAAMQQWRFAVSASSRAGQRFTQTFAFARAGQKNAGDNNCHEVIGSHICRRPGE